MTALEKRAVYRMVQHEGWSVVERWLVAQVETRRKAALKALADMDFQEAHVVAVEARTLELVLSHVQGLAKEAEQELAREGVS